MKGIAISQQEIDHVVQAENIQLPDQAKALAGVDLCQAVAVIIPILENLPVKNPILKIAIPLVVGLLKQLCK